MAWNKASHLTVSEAPGMHNRSTIQIMANKSTIYLANNDQGVNY